MGNGLTLYDARNVSWKEARGVVQYVSCGVVFPHRVLICPRDGCGRHAARQSGDLNHAELYCCVPCAQLEGHSDRCGRVYSSHTSVGGPSGTPSVDDTDSHGLDLAVCGFKSNGDDSGLTAQVISFPVAIPADDVPAASTSPITSPATLATVSSTRAVSPDINHICRISGCVRLPTDTEHGKHTVCCDTCSHTDGRFHTLVCDAADYALNVSSSSTVSTLVGTTDTNDFIPG